MALGSKVRIKAVTADSRATTGTQDFTYSGFGTPKAALVFISDGATAGTPNDDLRFSVGATDGTRHWAICGVCAHNQSGTTQTARRGATDEVAMQLNYDGTVVHEGNFDSWITDGIRINWTVVPGGGVQKIVTVVLIAGDDVTARADKVTLSTQDTLVHYTSMGFEADLLWCACSGAPINDSLQTEYVPSFGAVWNGDTVVQRAIAIASRDNTTPATCGGEFITDGGAIQSLETGTTWRADFSNFDSAGFDVHARDGNSGGDEVGFLALNIGANNLWMGTIDTPTSATTISYEDPAFQPLFLFQWCSAYSAVDTHRTNGEAGVIGMHVNDSIDECSYAMAEEDAANPTNNESLFTDSGLEISLHDGSAMQIGTTAFDSLGWNLTTTTSNGTARKWIAIAIGEVSAGCAHLVAPRASTQQAKDNVCWKVKPC